MTLSTLSRRGFLAGSAAALSAGPSALVAASDAATAIRPFQFHAPQARLDDMRRRILSTQWPEQETVADESQGVQLATMRELAQYWAGAYDWRKCEARLNALPQFVTQLDGLDIHVPRAC
jgi:hypothetical protein